jgi:hypothetical protein
MPSSLRPSPRCAALATILGVLALGLTGGVATPVHAQGGEALGVGRAGRHRGHRPNAGGLACPSVSLCLAHAGGDVAWTADPARGASAWRVSRAVLPGSTRDVECPTERLCVAISGSRVLVSTDPTGEAPWAEVPTGVDGGLFAVACASEALCVAGGDGGEAAISTAPAGGAGGWRTVPIDATSCPDAGACTDYGSGATRRSDSSRSPAPRPSSAWRATHGPHPQLHPAGL